MPRRKDRRDSHCNRVNHKTRRPRRKNQLDPAGDRDEWRMGILRQGQYNKYVPAIYVTFTVN